MKNHFDAVYYHHANTISVMKLVVVNARPI